MEGLFGVKYLAMKTCSVKTVHGKTVISYCRSEIVREFATFCCWKWCT